MLDDKKIAQDASEKIINIVERYANKAEINDDDALAEFISQILVSLVTSYHETLKDSDPKSADLWLKSFLTNLSMRTSSSLQIIQKENSK